MARTSPATRATAAPEQRRRLTTFRGSAALEATFRLHTNKSTTIYYEIDGEIVVFLNSLIRS
jgi:hypothetical protein